MTKSLKNGGREEIDIENRRLFFSCDLNTVHWKGPHFKKVYFEAKTWECLLLPGYVIVYDVYQLVYLSKHRAHIPDCVEFWNNWDIGNSYINRKTSGVTKNIEKEFYQICPITILLNVSYLSDYILVQVLVILGCFLVCFSIRGE